MSRLRLAQSITWPPLKLVPQSAILAAFDAGRLSGEIQGGLPILPLPPAAHQVPRFAAACAEVAIIEQHHGQPAPHKLLRIGSQSKALFGGETMRHQNQRRRLLLGRRPHQPCIAHECATGEFQLLDRNPELGRKAGRPQTASSARQQPLRSAAVVNAPADRAFLRRPMQLSDRTTPARCA